MRSPAQILDDSNFVDFYNQSKILDSAYYFPDQCRQSWQESFETIIPESLHAIANIVYTGMGGSAIPGRLIKSLSPRLLKIPFEVVTDFHLPDYVGSDTLVIAVSYSGETTETLNTASEARERGAKLFCISSGGTLQKLATTYSLPGYFFAPLHNPSGYPRMGSGYALMAILALLSKSGLTEFCQDQAFSLIHFLKCQSGNFTPLSPFAHNPAKLLAHLLWGKIPVIVSSQHLLGGAHALKNMINENSKNFSVLFDVPELEHHLLEGLSFPVTNPANLVFLSIESQLFHPEAKNIFATLRQICRSRGFTYQRLIARSGKYYTEPAEILQLGSFISFYLGALNHTDPGPIPWVEHFKSLT